MSKELVELSELYSSIVEQGGASLPSDYKKTEKSARDLESKHNDKSGKNLDKRARVTVDGKTYYEGEPGYDAAMKKAGPSEINSPEGVLAADHEKKFQEQEKTVERDNPNYGENGKFEKQNKARAKEISPASFSTSQRQTRELLKKNSDTPYPKIEKSDLNQFNRSKTYTADDGKTQVQRSTVFTKHYKTGKPLGVMGKSQRQKYDLEYANYLKNKNSNTSSNSSTITKQVPSKFAANKDKETFKRRDQKLLDKGLKPPTYTKTVVVNPEIKEESGCGSKKKKKKKTYYEGLDAYDSVMSYLMGTSQVESIEEANHIMMEMDGKTINDIKALAEGMPQYVRDSIGRQYGTGKYKDQPYTIEDKKNVINWYSRIKA